MDQTIHTLGEYLDILEQKGLLAAELPENLDRSAPVPLVSYDSREVIPGTLFICKGAHFKEDFLASAREKGAAAYVSRTPYPAIDLPCIQINDLRLTIAPLADLYYNHPSGKMNVIGITGTKGKSSTTYYLKYILDAYMENEKKPLSGVVSSIDTYDGVESFESHLTTPEPLDLQRHFANGVKTGMEYMTMEVSSQALKYHRSLCTEFAVACFLNIGKDHISPIEHPDFEDYFTSKLKIFRQANVSCVNLDCDHADRVLEAAQAAGKPVYTFSQKNEEADVYGFQVRKRGTDILFKVRTRRFQREFRLTMPGLFNVENALAAIAVCEALKVPERAIYVGLMKARVPGRMEVYANADETVTAIVDYAHNRMSFETLFRSVKAEYPGRRIVTVFGCPGKKALDRRKDLGEVSGMYSDLVMLTEEDSGEEDTMDICRQIAVHVAGQGGSYSIEPNRGEAIRQAILGCEEPTVLLITGKGAETRQKRGTQYIDTPSDVEYVHTYLQEYDLAHGLDGMEKVKSLLSILPVLKRRAAQTVVVNWDGGEGTALQDLAALRMVGMRVVLTACENRELVNRLAGLEVSAVGLTGQDGGLLTADQEGRVTQVNTKVLNTLLEADFLPVVAPIALGEEGEAVECAADEAARALAEALGAEDLIFLTEGGILIDSHNTKTAVDHIDAKQAAELMDAGLIAGDMVDKVKGCIHAIKSGVGQASILDGGLEHALLLDMLGQRVSGTTISE